MTNRIRILESAQSLFNEKGLTAPSLRDIATKADVSLGNLTYHFKSKEPIVLELYERMVGELQTILAAPGLSHSVLESLLMAPEETFSISLNYRFLFTGFAEIMRNFPLVKARFDASNRIRQSNYLVLFERLKHEEFVKPDFGEPHFLTLMQHSGAVRTYFFMEHAALSDEKLLLLKTDYINLVNALLFPYLSEKGRRLYELFHTS